MHRLLINKSLRNQTVPEAFCCLYAPGSALPVIGCPAGIPADIRRRHRHWPGVGWQHRRMCPMPCVDIPSMKENQ
jgi:hypothetical protein